MTTINNILILISLLLIIVSCEKVIDLDLNESNPKPVFESYIENDSTCYVKATLTSSYYDNSTSPVIPNATISLSDQNNQSETLTYEGQGIYRGNTMLGQIGSTYELTINFDGNTYTAQSTMPPLTTIDSIEEVQNSFFGGSPSTILFIHYKDDASLVNYYAKEATYWDSTSNDYASSFGITNDDISNGLETSTVAAFRQFEEGDTVTLALASIDYPTYLYFKTLEDAISGAGFASAAPANPISNFDGDALGYFGAWSREDTTVVVGE